MTIVALFILNDRKLSKEEMDKSKRDMLTDGLAYLQSNLTVTWAMVHRLVDEGVLTMEEGQDIWVSIKFNKLCKRKVAEEIR